MQLLPGILLILCATLAAQTSSPIAASELSQRKELLRNHRVTASIVELAPGETQPLHRHEHDMVSVYTNGGHIRNTLPKHRPEAVNLTVGEVLFHEVGYTHSITNDASTPLRVVGVEFADPQGKLKRMNMPSHYCNPGNDHACVDETNLFCTDRICVSDVTIDAGAVTTKHGHATDHMLVAVSDYELTDEVEGKGTVVRTRKSGEVEYVPAGINHRLTNTGKTAARFTVIVWR
jgi:quercetin dioxygenase-like cupin family protein